MLNGEPRDDPVDRVIELHLLDELLRHRRELASTADVIDRGWLPDPHNAETRQHLDTLRSHLRQIGQPTFRPAQQRPRCRTLRAADGLIAILYIVGTARVGRIVFGIE